ncbi:hypothetical protein EV700_1675 [Fluviicoccus keumensis]|uniref:FilE C-terminal domain-containing protein n=2 Tax=Fluviicoccus keumensis TaxID=1435465 RepID=A0A4Q7Z4I2_9GAMM|nr:hypothetical protein EV700_1675 [Fluviicoccus keumensis]
MRGCFWVFCLMPLVAGAADKFYPTIGTDGRLQVIRAPAQQPVSPPPASKDPSSSAGVVQGKPVIVPPKSDATAGSSSGKDQLEGESYLTSEQLERKGYKPEGKNRFYYLPDGGPGHTPIESDEGIPIPSGQTAKSEPAFTEAVRPSPNYQSLQPAEVLKLQPELAKCLTQKVLRHSRKIREINRLSIEEPISISDTDADVLINLSDLQESAIRIRSYSVSMAVPAYYVPFPVWFDRQGCVMAGAWNFWVNEVPGTDYKYGLIESVLVQPGGAHYLGFYFPKAEQRAPFQLRHHGAMTLEVFE